MSRELSDCGYIVVASEAQRAAAAAAAQWRPSVRPPDYADIPAATAWLQVWVTVVGIVGGVVLALGLLIVVTSALRLQQPSVESIDRAHAWSAISTGIGASVSGVFLFAVSATMNVIARFGRPFATLPGTLTRTLSVIVRLRALPRTCPQVCPAHKECFHSDGQFHVV